MDRREQEYEAFQRLFHSLKEAISAANSIGLAREDKRWAQISALLSKMLDSAYKLAGKGWTRS